ncbi:MAG: hypothetical protein IJ773_07395 [Lachnospiraceae bacterium]|nr:hypothetical protein [Lachnospiraceae bacterium]
MGKERKERKPMQIFGVWRSRCMEKERKKRNPMQIFGVWRSRCMGKERKERNPMQMFDCGKARCMGKEVNGGETHANKIFPEKIMHGKQVFYGPIPCKSKASGGEHSDWTNQGGQSIIGGQKTGTKTTYP